MAALVLHESSGRAGFGPTRFVGLGQNVSVNVRLQVRETFAGWSDVKQPIFERFPEGLFVQGRKMDAVRCFHT